MSMKVRAVRGRVPSIATAADKARDLRKNVRGLLGDLRTEGRLRALDRMYQRRQAYYKALAAEAVRLETRSSAAASTMRGRGPNVRDVAFELLQKLRGPQPIQKIADQGPQGQGGRAGANFVQNLGVALQRDRPVQACVARRLRVARRSLVSEAPSCRMLRVVPMLDDSTLNPGDRFIPSVAVPDPCSDTQHGRPKARFSDT